jgi:hypothetical protein
MPPGKGTVVFTGSPLAERSRVSGRPFVGRVPLGLPAVGRQGLGEVAVPVQQAHADDRDAEVARGLQVVARQDAEAA